jgi:hypothetical protein
VIISCTEGNKLLPYNSRIHEVPKIEKRIPAKSMNGIMEIKKMNMSITMKVREEHKLIKRLVKQ